MAAATVTELNDRARGWLRFVYDKATTPDDWSSGGEPLGWWDRDSTAPMCSFPRFDIGEMSYTLPLMADVTPAWREVYTEITTALCERHTTFWAAIDWLTLIGPDPNVDRYPPEWLIFTPEKLRGKYEPPGWTGNGREPWGLAPDPVAADGNNFFRGWFNLLLSAHAYVSGDEQFREPFEITGFEDRRFTWTHQEIAGFISEQLTDRPEGAHCENTKIWPACVSAAGLGLKLHDAVYGSRLNGAYDGWVEFAQAHYMHVDRRGELDWFALYYDPLERLACTPPDHLAAYASLIVLPYVMPQRPEWGTELYEMTMRRLGWSDPKARLREYLPDPRFLAIARQTAHELGDDVTEGRLNEVVESTYEPRMFGDEESRFGYFFGWGEEYPRGQPNALLIMPELGGAGAWGRVFNEPNLAKFDEPTVEGIDYPSLGLSVARNDHEAGELRVGTYAATPSHAGRATTWRVVGLPDPTAVSVTCDGREFTGWRVVGDDAIEVALEIGTHDVRVQTGYRPGRPA
nr:hypothetical protein [Solirubrobacterales bacterium]